jgi:LAO/AO transport system kinase
MLDPVNVRPVRDVPAGPPSSFAKLLDDFAGGRPAALARIISIVENHRSGYDRVLADLHHRTGRARRIGITGPPGAGKSTLTTQLVRAYRARGLTVGVIAVDPTSPFTGGALLGDRIRMEEIALDPGVYIRSLATRGALGGLSAATREASDVLDAFGFDRIVVETVGVGQSELEVARTVDSCVVVLVPESGDSIQALKAGLMEIADIFVINKADRPGADRLRNEIKLMLHLRSRTESRDGLAKGTPSGRAHALAAKPPGDGEASGKGSDASGGWTPPVLATVATEGTGVLDVLSALDRHYEYLSTTELLAVRRRSRLRERVADVIDQKVRARLWEDPATVAWLNDRLGALETGTATPFEVADELLRRSATLITGSGA